MVEFIFKNICVLIWLLGVFVVACRISVSDQGLNPGPLPALGPRSLSHWATRKAPKWYT